MKVLIGLLLISGVINSCDNDQQQRESSRLPIFSDLRQKDNSPSDTPISVHTIGIPSHLVNPNQIKNHPVYLHNDETYIMVDILMFGKKDSPKNLCKPLRSQGASKPKSEILLSSSDEDCLQQ